MRAAQLFLFPRPLARPSCPRTCYCFTLQKTSEEIRSAASAIVLKRLRSSLNGQGSAEGSSSNLNASAALARSGSSLAPPPPLRHGLSSAGGARSRSPIITNIDVEDAPDLVGPLSRADGASAPTSGGGASRGPQQGSSGGGSFTAAIHSLQSASALPGAPGGSQLGAALDESDDGAWLEAISAFRQEAHQRRHRFRDGLRISVAFDSSAAAVRAVRGGHVAGGDSGTSGTTGSLVRSGVLGGSGGGSGAGRIGALWFKCLSRCGLRRVASNAADLGDVMEEIRRTVALRHPKIVSTLGAVVEPGTDPVLVLEVMDRGSLQELLYNQSVDLRDFTVPILRDVAEVRHLLPFCICVRLFFSRVMVFPGKVARSK